MEEVDIQRLYMYMLVLENLLVPFSALLSFGKGRTNTLSGWTLFIGGNERLRRLLIWTVVSQTDVVLPAVHFIIVVVVGYQ